MKTSTISGAGKVWTIEWDVAPKTSARDLHAPDVVRIYKIHGDISQTKGLRFAVGRFLREHGLETSKVELMF